jgi:hypothetical protein
MGPGLAKKFEFFGGSWVGKKIEIFDGSGEGMLICPWVP